MLQQVLCLVAYLATFIETYVKIWRGLLFMCQSPISDYLHKNLIFLVYDCIIFKSWSESAILESSEHENCNFTLWEVWSNLH